MIRSITGTITTKDGDEVQFHMDIDGIQRWGASPRAIAETVEATEAAQEAIANHGEWRD